MAVKRKKKDELIPTRRSVHVIFLSCPHCGNEIDDIKLCPECGEPMKVIDIVEKFGDDAERFLERAKKRLEKSKENISQEEEEEEFESIDKEEPNIILMGDENFDEDDGGIDASVQVEDGSLDVIFPDDEEHAKPIIPAGDDLTKALEQLDTEEEENITAEDFGFDDGEIPEL
ncbi:MAG: hypothetical protein ACOX6Q_01350 [Candidatus Dojkabacteria bacterium]|jgi:hypothetical protein